MDARTRPWIELARSLPVDLRSDAPLLEAMAQQRVADVVDRLEEILSGARVRRRSFIASNRHIQGLVEKRELLWRWNDEDHPSEADDEPPPLTESEEAEVERFEEELGDIDRRIESLRNIIARVREFEV